MIVLPQRSLVNDKWMYISTLHIDIHQHIHGWRGKHTIKWHAASLFQLKLTSLWPNRTHSTMSVMRVWPAYSSGVLVTQGTNLSGAQHMVSAWNLSVSSHKCTRGEDIGWAGCWLPRQPVMPSGRVLCADPYRVARRCVNPLQWPVSGPLLW